VPEGPGPVDLDLGLDLEALGEAELEAVLAAARARLGGGGGAGGEDGADGGDGADGAGPDTSRRRPWRPGTLRRWAGARAERRRRREVGLALVDALARLHGSAAAVARRVEAKPDRVYAWRSGLGVPTDDELAALEQLAEEAGGADALPEARGGWLLCACGARRRLAPGWRG